MRRYFRANSNEYLKPDKLEKELFTDFNIVDGYVFGENGQIFASNEAFKDLRVVDQEFTYVPGDTSTSATLVVTFETLTDTFVQETPSLIVQEANGLLRLTRTLIANPGATYTKVIGTESITVDGQTLYLESAERSEDERFDRMQETFVEFGLLSTNVVPTGSGLLRKTYVFRGSKGSVDGIEVSERIDNVNGLEQITITSILQADGSSFVGTPSTGTSTDSPTNTTTEFELDGNDTALVDQIITITSGAASGDSRIISAVNGNRITVSTAFSAIPGAATYSLLAERQSDSYQQDVPFMIPGIASIGKATGTINSLLQHEYYLDAEAPIEALIKSTVYDFITTDSNINESDYKIEGSIGLWNPSDGWAQVKADAIGTNFSATTPVSLSNTRPMRGFRTSDASNDIVSVSGTNGTSWTETKGDATTNTVSGPSANGVLLDGQWVIPSGSFSLVISGGPEDPRGNTYALGASVVPYTEGSSGVKYYKKRITIATIPS